METRHKERVEEMERREEERIRELEMHYKAVGEGEAGRRSERAGQRREDVGAEVAARTDISGEDGGG